MICTSRGGKRAFFVRPPSRSLFPPPLSPASFSSPYAAPRHFRLLFLSSNGTRPRASRRRLLADSRARALVVRGLARGLVKVVIYRPARRNDPGHRFNYRSFPSFAKATARPTATGETRHPSPPPPSPPVVAVSIDRYPVPFDPRNFSSFSCTRARLCIKIN